MKKGNVILLCCIIIVLSVLSEVALSLMKDNQWSNYSQSWNMKKKRNIKFTAKVKTFEDGITYCSSKR